MDRLRAIEYFIKVAELGSFTSAAKAIGVPASSISRRIQDLEAELGTTLLNRTTRSVNLTELGAVYLEQVRPALKALDYAGELINDRPSAPSGFLRITAMPGYGGLHLMPAIHKLRAQYPDLIIDVELSDQVYNLANHEVDIAVRGTSDLPDRAIARKLASSDMMLVASPAYFAANPPPTDPANLTRHNCVAYRQPGSAAIYRWEFTDPATGNDVPVDPEGCFVTNSDDLMLSTALQGGAASTCRLIADIGQRPAHDDAHRVGEITLAKFVFDGQIDHAKGAGSAVTVAGTVALRIGPFLFVLVGTFVVSQIAYPEIEQRN